VAQYIVSVEKGNHPIKPLVKYNGKVFSEFMAIIANFVDYFFSHRTTLVFRVLMLWLSTGNQSRL
jgi:hypothetical protein